MLIVFILYDVQKEPRVFPRGHREQESGELFL